MVGAEATFSTYQQFVRRVCLDVGRKEAFIVRPSYARVREALERGEVDVAFVCTGTYLHSLRDKSMRLLVQPVFRDSLDYRCLVIVPAQSSAATLDDLRGAVMAFTDSESNTGCIVPCATMLTRGLDPKSYFRKVVFTGSHDRSIMAVAHSVVDGAAVDSLVWHSALRQDPELARRVRIIWQSEPFGPPPVVVSAMIDPALETSLRKALLAMDKDPAGHEILSELGIERFELPRPQCYETAMTLYEDFERRGGMSWP